MHQLPEHFQAGYLTTPDGFDIYSMLFRSEHTPCKGTVILLQGRNECIEKYDRTIRDILDRGFDVGTFDFRGQGRSQRLLKDKKRGYIDSFDQYVIDIETVFAQAILPELRAPFFVLAHSAGGLTALYAAPHLANRVQRMVLACPFLGPSEEGPRRETIRPVSKALCFLGLGTLYAGGSDKGMPGTPFLENRLTSDEVRYHQNQALLDPEKGLGLGGPTFAWMRAAMEAMDSVHDADHMAKVHIPTLMVAAGADTVVSPTAIQTYARSIRSGALLTIDGARHELLQEADKYRDQFLAAFDAFIPGTAPKA